MKRIITSVVCICLSGVFLTSCVSKRKYVSARTRAADLANENTKLTARVKGQQDTINALHSRVGALGNANENTANELLRTSNELYKTSSELNMTKDQIEAQRKRLEQLQTLIA